MIRGLVMIAVGGAAVAATSLAGSGAFREKSWNFPDFIWSSDDGTSGPDIMFSDNAPSAERSLTWAGGERLKFSVPAVIVFTQGATPSITVSGPAPLVDHVVLNGDQISLNGHVSHFHSGHSLHIAITAPNLHEFDLESAQDLHIAAIDTPKLKIDISGAGDVHAAGKVGVLDLTLEGLGNADLSNLMLTDARIEIDGVGDVKAGPSGNADLEINGAGAITLTRRPAHLTQEINGPGSVDVPKAPAGTTL